MGRTGGNAIRRFKVRGDLESTRGPRKHRRHGRSQRPSILWVEGRPQAEGTRLKVAGFLLVRSPRYEGREVVSAGTHVPAVAVAISKVRDMATRSGGRALCYS